VHRSRQKSGREGAGSSEESIYQFHQVIIKDGIEGHNPSIPLFRGARQCIFLTSES
jgi:hypothetical protein